MKFTLEEMTVRDSKMTGKKGELIIIKRFLDKDYTLYTPVVDVEGIDCILKNSNDKLFEIQIKTRNRYIKPVSFEVLWLKPRDRYFICCYNMTDDEVWMIPAKIFKDLAGDPQKTKNGDNEYIIEMNEENRKNLEKYKGLDFKESK